MKKSILFLTLLFLLTEGFSQIRFHHRIRMSTLKKYGFNLVSVAGAAQASVDLCTLRKGTITVSNGNINLDLWQILDKTTCTNGITRSTPITSLRIVDGRTTFGLPTKTLWVPFQSINIGVNTLPFRYRLPVTINDTTQVNGIGTTSFQLAFNIGYTFGWSAITSRVLNNYSITLGGYFGPATTDLKKGVYKDPSKYVSDQTNASLTYGLNIILARNTLGLVFAYGSENALGKNSGQWIYNGRPYFAFGINTGFGR